MLLCLAFEHSYFTTALYWFLFFFSKAVSMHVINIYFLKPSPQSFLKFQVEKKKKGTCTNMEQNKMQHMATLCN